MMSRVTICSVDYVTRHPFSEAPISPYVITPSLAHIRTLTGSLPDSRLLSSFKKYPSSDKPWPAPVLKTARTVVTLFLHSRLTESSTLASHCGTAGNNSCSCDAGSCQCSNCVNHGHTATVNHSTSFPVTTH